MASNNPNARFPSPNTLVTTKQPASFPLDSLISKIPANVSHTAHLNSAVSETQYTRRNDKSLSRLDSRDYCRKIQSTSQRKEAGHVTKEYQEFSPLELRSTIQAGQRYSWRKFRVFEFQTSDSPSHDEETARKRKRKRGRCRNVGE